MDLGKELEQLEDSSVQFESRLEILRAERADKRTGRDVKFDQVRDDEGIDEDDPLINIDDGIRLEPFNMRREMAEGHFDDAGMYVIDKDQEKEVTDAWLDTVDQAEKSATFLQEKRYEDAQKKAASTISALKRNLGKDADAEDPDGDGGDDGSWMVEIDRSSGGRLGIGLDVIKSEESGDRVEVDDIDDEGLIAAWSKANPSKAVEVGDRILELNGESTTEGITGGLGKREVMKLNFKFIREEKVNEPEEEKDTATMIEALVSDLLPLETPVQALARFTKAASARGPAASSAAEPLKTRARMKKDRAAEASRAAAASAAATVATDAPRATRRKLNEWGDYEAGAAPTAAATESSTPPAEGGSAAAATKQAASAEAMAGSRSTLLADKDAAVAAAAEKAAATDKAVAEAAAAAAAEARVARHVLYMDVDPSKGPEAAALEQAQKREAGKAEAKEERQPPTLAATSRKRVAEPGILEQARRRKIERLTDLCDRLLERGVLVYESTREQLAIEVRQRRKEFEKTDGEKEGAADDKAADSKDKAVKTPAAGAEGKVAEEAPAAAAAPAEMVWTNRSLLSTSAGDSAGGGLLGLLSNEGAGAVDPDANGAGASLGRPLMWQMRWEATKDTINGPFDSVTMHGWMTQGCFESEERAAEVRQCDSANTATEQCWHPMTEMNFGLYL